MNNETDLASERMHKKKALEHMMEDGFLSAEVFDKLADEDIKLSDLNVNKRTHYFMVSAFDDRGHYKYLIADVTGSKNPENADLEFHARMYGKKGTVLPFSNRKQAIKCTELLKDHMVEIAKESGKVGEVRTRISDQGNNLYGLVKMEITGYQREKIIDGVNKKQIRNKTEVNDIVSLYVPELTK